MNPQLTVIRTLSMLAARKWAAEVIDQPTSPLPDVTPAPAEAENPFMKYVPDFAAKLMPKPAVTPPVADVPPLSTPSPAIVPPAATPAVPATPAPSLAAATPPGQTTEAPVPADAMPPPKGEPAKQPSFWQGVTDKAKGAFKTIAEKATDTVNAGIDEKIGQSIDGLHAMPEPDLMNTAGEFFSDWHNWIMPVAALGALFGGTTGKILGALATVGGGVDLYNRYKAVEGLGQTPAGQQLIQSALTFKDAQGKPQPFGNIQELMKAAPDQAQALKDLSLAAKLGAKNQLINRIVESGITEGEKLGVPANTIINRLVETRRISSEQGQEMLKNLAQTQGRLAQQAPAAPAAARG